jgi:hypothetical protein
MNSIDLINLRSPSSINCEYIKVMEFMMKLFKIGVTVLLSMVLFGVSAGAFADSKVSLPAGFSHLHDTMSSAVKGVQEGVDQAGNTVSFGAKATTNAAEDTTKATTNGVTDLTQ